MAAPDWIGYVILPSNFWSCAVLHCRRVMSLWMLTVSSSPTAAWHVSSTRVAGPFIVTWILGITDAYRALFLTRRKGNYIAICPRNEFHLNHSSSFLQRESWTNLRLLFVLRLKGRRCLVSASLEARFMFNYIFFVLKLYYPVTP
jgi:hypothetical protein